MRDEDIDYSDIPEITDEMWEKGIVRKGFKPIPKETQENLPIDRDIIEYFKKRGENYQTQINQLLRGLYGSESGEIILRELLKVFGV